MQATEQILQLIKKSILVSAPDATLILYGSYARGDFNEGSDIDLLVLLNQDKVTYDDRVRIAYPLYDIQYDNGILISPMVCSKAVWENKYAATPFYENVIKEGVVL